MDELMIKNFFYTSTPENEGVLFHIPTGRFFRVFDQKYKYALENRIISGDTLEMLRKINSNQTVHSCPCKECDSQVRRAKDFTIRKLALVLTSSCNMRCKYCYANYGMYDYEEAADMNSEKLESILSYFTKNFKGIGAIQFFGGEPTLKEELIYQTVDYFKRLVEAGEIDTMPMHFALFGGRKCVLERPLCGA